MEPPLSNPRTPLNLYEAYARLRDRRSIAWDGDDGAYLVARHADVTACLRHPSLSSAITPRSLLGIPEDVATTYTDVLHRQLDLMDPPGHTALKQALSVAFSRARIDGLDEFARRWLDECLHTLPHRFDVVTAVAQPLSLAVVIELLGLGSGRGRTLQRLVSSFAAGLANPAAAHADTSDALAELRRLVREALADPDIGNGGVLGLGHDAVGQTMSFPDLIANVVLLLAAGHPTTAHLIGNAVWLLLTHSSAAATLSRQPDAWTTAIEEVLRLESPVQQVRRIAIRPFELAGHMVDAGTELVLLLGSANRDPEVFATEFDVEREPNRHVAFGGGHHACPGAPLARMLARLALEALCALPALRLVDPEPAWEDSLGYRGLQHLMVEWGSAST